MGVVDEYFDKWVAEDGGGRLDLDDALPAFGPCKLATTRNENPILFLSQMAVEVCRKFPEQKPRFRECYMRHMASTELQPGLHSRRCGDSPSFSQSHDNIVGMMIGSWLLGTPFGEKVYQYGSANRWCFNVQEPNVYDAKFALQGGDIAICAFATNRKPESWYTLWLAGGLALSTDWNLADLRIQLLEQIQPMLSWWEKMMLGTAIAISKWRRGPTSKYGGTRFGYYRAEHPFSRFQKGEP